jgi:hypothetical protein
VEAHEHGMLDEASNTDFGFRAQKVG